MRSVCTSTLDVPQTMEWSCPQCGAKVEHAHAEFVWGFQAAHRLFHSGHSEDTSTPKAL
jgi:hypothetical protein